MYPINRVAQTPLDRYTVIDVMRNTLGVGPCEHILDLEGQKAEYKGMATCGVRDTLTPIYKNHSQKANRAQIDETLNAGLTFVKHIRGRITRYIEFEKKTREYLAEQKQAHPELATLIAELDGLTRQIDERVAARVDKIKTPEHVARMNEDFRKQVLDDHSEGALKKCQAYTRALVEIGDNQDELSGECRWVVKALRQRAGILIALDPRVAPIASELRRERRRRSAIRPSTRERGIDAGNPNPESDRLNRKPASRILVRHLRLHGSRFVRVRGERDSLMYRCVICVFVAVALSSTGCGKSEPGRPAAEVIAGEMVLVPAGTFTMGDGGGRPDETPHIVSVSAFYLDTYPVTQELYEKVMGVNPSKQKGRKNPVEKTQWTDAVRFCNKSSELEGLTPCYDLNTWECNFDASGYRLPTEAEWEYACRAGGTGKYGFGDDETELPKYAWFKPHSQGKTRPIGQKRPNAWGLQEMHGNVWQWCHDWYDEAFYQASPPENPHGPATGKMRVLRGGAWDCTAEKLRSAYRHKEFPVYSDACFGADSYGFRRARKADGGERPVAVAAAGHAAAAHAESSAKPAAVAPDPRVVPEQASGTIDLSRLQGTIVFASDRGGTMKIWRMHASGRDASQLTRGADPDADPRFSPDGTRVLYTTLHDGFPQIWLMNRDGSDPKFVTNGSQGSWSPDGKTIIFIQDNQAKVRDLAAGLERRVTPEGWDRCGVPSFAPDGKHFAVASRHLGNIDIFILSLDGKENERLKSGEACCTPQWSKDGKRILCQTVQGHIHHVDLDGKNWEQLTFGADLQHDARYSPDGTMILFCRAPSPEGPWQICLKKLDDDLEDFVPLTKDGSNLLPDWHPSQ